MTENKRFTLNQSYLNSKWYYVYDESTDFQFPTLTEGESEIFCEKLNTLHDENKELKMITNLFSDRELKRLQQFEQKVKETLNEAFDKNFSNSEILLMWIATELGVDLE